MKLSFLKHFVDLYLICKPEGAKCVFIIVYNKLCNKRLPSGFYIPYI